MGVSLGGLGWLVMGRFTNRPYRTAPTEPPVQNHPYRTTRTEPPIHNPPYRIAPTEPTVQDIGCNLCANSVLLLLVKAGLDRLEGPVPRMKGENHGI
jgi:hypothetical protein